MENIINFSYNWNNKLDCKAFTTIRLYQPGKYKEGTIYKIMLKEENKGNGMIVQIKNFQLDSLNEFIARLDTGYDVAECKRVIQTMYRKVDFKKQLLSLILIKKVV